MDHVAFDRWTRSVFVRRSRRSLLHAVLGAAIGGPIMVWRRANVAAQVTDVRLAGICSETAECAQGPVQFGPVVCADNGIPEDGSLNCCRGAGGCCISHDQCCGTLDCRPAGDGSCGGFGTCLGGDARGGLPLGAICNETADCLSAVAGSVICAGNGDLEDGILNCCLEAGGACNGNDGLCCGDAVCIDGVCGGGAIAVDGITEDGGLPAGAICTATAECSQAGGAAICGDNGLAEDGALNCCLGEATPCATDAECCANLDCGDNQIGDDGVLNCCGYEGSACSADAGCCGANFCVEGVCQPGS